MNPSQDNRFQDFFDDEKYIALKNCLYNYLLRKRAVGKVMEKEEKGLVLEVGSGISPILTSCDDVIFSDISLSAMRMLKLTQGKGHYVVADAACLPFRASVFSHVISSEVMEHLKDDRKALREIFRVLKPKGSLVITFPHRRFYFGYDDRFVNHYRRYELDEMLHLLHDVNLDTVFIKKVLGPLEKVIMCTAIFFFSVFRRGQRKGSEQRSSKQLIILSPFFRWFNRICAVIVSMDAVIMPRALATVLLIKAAKKSESSE